MAEKTYDVTELFGSDVFNEAVMKARLPKAIFKELMKVMHGNAELTLPIAEVVACELSLAERLHIINVLNSGCDIHVGFSNKFLDQVGEVVLTDVRLHSFEFHHRLFLHNLTVLVCFSVSSF